MLLAVLVGAACGSDEPVSTATNSSNEARVLEVERPAPDTVMLLVGSCNQNPFVDELDQTEPGTYEVRVITELPDNGDECADGVTIDVDPDLDMITIIDRTSGESFELSAGPPTDLLQGDEPLPAETARYIGMNTHCGANPLSEVDGRYWRTDGGLFGT